MSNTISYETISECIAEIDKAVNDKKRVISDISNVEVKKIIEQCSSYSISNGIPSLKIAAIGCGIGIVGGAAGMAAAGMGAGAAGGVIAGGAIGGAVSGYVGGAATGAAVGSFFPFVGTLIGVAVGATVAVVAGKKSKDKSINKLKSLYNELLEKQNRQIQALIMEVEELTKKNKKLQENIDRLQYILGVLQCKVDIEELLRKQING